MKKTIFTFLIAISFISYSQKKPNVIVIVTDDQGHGDLSAHGNPWIKTPEMDKLYHNGVRLTDFHVDPTCAPTRASIMTGKYANKVGVWLTYASRHHIQRDQLTMADVFKQNGYATGIFGKWHLGDNYPFRPMDRGFDESLVHGGGVVGEAPDFWDNNYYDDTYFRNGEPEKVKGYCTDVWFNETMRFIEKNHHEPFFVYLPTNAAHALTHVPEKYRKPYKERASFYGSIACIDENVGRLRKKLQDLSLDKETLIVIFNDNGTAGGVVNAIDGKPNKDGWAVKGFNSGMRGRKGSHYEGGHRAYCFMYWPDGNLIGGRDAHGLTAHIDLIPTFMDLCDLKLKKKTNFDGLSIKPLLYGESTQKLDDRVIVVNDQSRFKTPTKEGHLIKYKKYSVMHKNWRLVGDQENPLALYDLKSDIGEKTDVSVQYPSVVKKLKKEYEKWWHNVSSHDNKLTSFVINPKKQRVVVINSQNLMGEDGDVAYNQRHVREAKKVNGYTYIDVEMPGVYQVALRRWPVETDKEIRSTDLPLLQVHPSTHNVKKAQQKAVLLDAVKARLKVGGFDKIVPVKVNDKEIVFEVELRKGQQKIQTWFELESGGTVAAYYTYIEKG